MRHLQLDDAERARFDLALAEGRLIVEGGMTTANYSGHLLGRFEADRAWEGQTGSPASGAWALIKESGKLCLVAPCAHLEEGLLNRRVATMIADLDFDLSGADDAQVAAAWRASQADGLIVAGQRYWESGVGGTAPARTVTEFYTVLAP